MLTGFGVPLIMPIKKLREDIKQCAKIKECQKCQSSRLYFQPANVNQFDWINYSWVCLVGWFEFAHNILFQL